MKEIRLVYDDYDHKRLYKVKVQTQLAWDDFILLLARIPVSVLNRIKQGEKIQW